MQSGDEINTSGAAIQVIPPTADAKANGNGSVKRIGRLTTMYWRPFEDESKAPIPVKVLQHIIRGGMTNQIESDAALSEARRGALLDQITTLIQKTGQYEAQLLSDEIDGKSLDPEENESARKLQKLNDKIAELQVKYDSTPTIWRLRSERLLCQVLADEYIEIEGEKIKVETHSLASMDNLYLIDLYGAVINFLLDGKKRKNGS